MRATEFVTELFEPNKNWQWDFTGSEEAHAEFNVGNIPYKFTAYTDPNNWGTWEVEFSVINPSRERKTKFGLTGTGNAAEVLSIVTDIMREFLQRYKGNVNQLIFTADEPSRKSLYARMVQRLLPDWNLKQYDKQFVVSAPENIKEDHVADVELDTGEKKRIRYIPTKKDIVDTVVRYYLRQGLRVVRVNNTEIEWKPSAPVQENFTDGKNPGRKGLAKRSGVNCKQSISKLRQVAKNSSGERQRMAHWCANMKSGKKK
jgi:hypothetical protein